MNKKVTILQDRLVHYRVGLFERLRKLAAERGIDLFLVHGQTSPLNKKRDEEGILDWAVQVKNCWWVVRGHDLLWQPFPRHLENSDLVIMLQHNRILSNYRIVFGRQRCRSKVAFWGHGKNFQSKHPYGVQECIKRRLIRAVDWWFTYTQLSVEVLEKAGFDPSRITCLDNAIDTKIFRSEIGSITTAEVERLRDQYALEADGFIGLFCGSLYVDKRPEIMLEAARIIKRQIPEFHLFVIGDGPSAWMIEKAAATYNWLHYVGPKKGRDKAAFFRLADVVINPGAVGLHVLDAFTAGLPMVTMADSSHGPEISYLRDGYNGYMTGNSSDDYAKAVIKLYLDKNGYRMICEHALLDSEKYTVEQMALNFINGIERCLHSGNCKQLFDCK